MLYKEARATFAELTPEKEEKPKFKWKEAKHHFGKFCILEF